MPFDAFDGALRAGVSRPNVATHVLDDGEQLRVLAAGGDDDSAAYGFHRNRVAADHWNADGGGGGRRRRRWS